MYVDGCISVVTLYTGTNQTVSSVYYLKTNAKNTPNKAGSWRITELFICNSPWLHSGQFHLLFLDQFQLCLMNALTTLLWIEVYL